MDFLFCPRCGNELEEKEEGAIWWCKNCPMHHYANPKPACEIVFYRGGKILISERGIDPGKGNFDMPGGFVELHEDFDAALVREVEEELAITNDSYSQPVFLRNYNVEYPHENTVHKVLVSVYIAELSGQAKPSAHDDVASIKWITRSDVDNIEWAGEQQQMNAHKAFAYIDETS